MVLSRYLVGLFFFVMFAFSLLLPRPSSAGPSIQGDEGESPASTPRPADVGDGAVDWENVELREGRDSYLPERGTPPPHGESRPEPGDAAPSPPESAPPSEVEPTIPHVAAPEGGTTYTVQPGDTLYDIAGRYGLTVAALASANNLTDPSVIFPGQVLAIPDESGSVAVAEPAATVTVAAVAATGDVPREGNAYTVRSGDSPYRIARRFGVPVQMLMEINNITNPTRLKVGQVLTIPGADVTVPPPPSKPPATPSPAAAADGAYVVQRGDTLYEIARRFGTMTAALIAANDLADPHRLIVGQVLVIPDADGRNSSTPPPPSPTATAPPPTPVVEETPAQQETGFIWPAEGRTIAQYYRYGHGAIDILLPVGTSIVAAADGVVEFSGWNNYGYGWLTIIDHGNGFRTLYAHQSELLVEAELEVKQGQLIGKSGHTGWSTHPHLHFEVILNNALNNPCAYLPGGC